MSPVAVERKPITLPTEATPPSKKWADQKHLMLGPGKIGKSGFWAEGENNLFLQTEAGLNHLNCKRIAIRDWADVRETFGLLQAAALKPPFPYETIIVDTVDMFIVRAGEEVVARAKKFYKAETAEKINTIGDIPEGKGWFTQKELIRLSLDKLSNLPCGLALIGHVQQKEIKEPTRVYQKATINIGGQVGTSLLHWADHTLHVQSSYEGSRLKRVIRTLPADTIEAGSRGLIVPDGMEWGPNSAENYKKFRALFD